MLRVAAYCRVSTSQEDQRNSLENQRRYFSEYISRQPDWELVEVYADEGLSGTSSDRPAFRRMLAAVSYTHLRAHETILNLVWRVVGV